eukprot:jgi/Picre1/35813/NNA_003273.t1
MPGCRIGPFYIGQPSREQQEEVVQQVPRLPWNYDNRRSTVKKEGQDAPRTNEKKNAVDRAVQTIASSVFFSEDSSQVRLGSGRKAFKKASQMILSWEHFRLGWAYTNSPDVRVGAPVVVVARALGLWTINPLRVCSKQIGRNRVSFCHRTLEGHQLAGEETFVVDMKKDGSVWYGVQTVSRPDTLVALLAYPLLRVYQNKFKEDSMKHMCAAIQK